MEEAVQGLLHAAMHAEDFKYFVNLRALLQEVLQHKAERAVDAMLVRVYDPLLWRALQCANAEVRSQAAALFLDAFPLIDRDEGHAAVQEALQRQVEVMQQLLADSDHRVRATAVHGVCRCLRDYWAAFPSAAMQTLLVFICTKLARDVSCINVRCAALDGIGIVLGNPASHRVLTPLVKALAFAVHDKADRVREAFVRLLARCDATVEGYCTYCIYYTYLIL